MLMHLKGNISLAEQKEAGGKSALLNICLFHFVNAAQCQGRIFRCFKRGFKHILHSRPAILVGVEGQMESNKTLHSLLVGPLRRKIGNAHEERGMEIRNGNAPWDPLDKNGSICMLVMCFLVLHFQLEIRSVLVVLTVKEHEHKFHVCCLSLILID